MGDDSIDMGDDSIDMGYLVTLPPGPTQDSATIPNSVFIAVPDCGNASTVPPAGAWLSCTLRNAAAAPPPFAASTSNRSVYSHPGRKAIDSRHSTEIGA